MNTDEIDGVTIFDLKRWLDNDTIKDLKLPISIDFTSDTFAFAR